MGMQLSDRVEVYLQYCIPVQNGEDLRVLFQPLVHKSFLRLYEVKTFWIYYYRFANLYFRRI